MLFVRPALLKMQGARVLGRPRVEVELEGEEAIVGGRNIGAEYFAEEFMLLKL